MAEKKRETPCEPPAPARDPAQLARLPGEPTLAPPSDRPLSAATQRLYEKWGRYGDARNPFYTTFRYSTLRGLSPEAGITRRDPTTVLKLGDTYYVWYTRRATEADRNPRNRPPYQEQNWREPAYDWDLAEIWLATSRDGFAWQEQGRAVAPGPRDEFDGRSVFTPDVLLWRGKYYLYYQAVGYPYTNRTRNVIGMSWAERPEGPWRRCPQPVLEPGAAGEWEGEGDSDNVRRYGAWDGHKVHDPFTLVRDGRIWLYYKGQPMGWATRYSPGIGWGVALADEPAGPFEKSPLNPVTNSGHETCLFPYGEGVAAICGHDGPEKDSVQYAADGLNFEVMAHVVLPPPAGGPFAPDSYADTSEGWGISWGLCHIATEEQKCGNSYLLRFDCNLQRGAERPGFRRSNLRFPEGAYFSPDMAFTEANERPRAYPQPEPEEPPEPLTPPHSAATKRVRQVYGRYKDAQSPFFSAFRYGRVTGIGEEASVTRRDPSKVIRIGEEYFVWYTRRQTAEEWRGIAQATAMRPAFDWDLGEIWYATSTDGWRWRERGRAVARGAAGEYDERAVFTPDVLVWGGRYYLYYQVTQGIWRARGIHQIGLAEADSPHGPWRKLATPILRVGTGAAWEGEADDIRAVSRFGEWDSQKLHDPYVLVRGGKIWLYYKGVPIGRHYRDDLGCQWGVAMADEPTGPFAKSPLNPITNSGHETFLYPWQEGVAAITSLEGPEKNTVQYAADGLNFEVVGKVSVPPIAAGPYVADAFTNMADGRGIRWGLCHIAHGQEGMRANSYIARFECELSADGDRRADFYRPWNYRWPPETYLSHDFRLSPAGEAAAREWAQRWDEETRVPTIRRSAFRGSG